MHKLLLLSSLAVVAVAGSPAFALEGGLPRTNASQLRAERIDVCADRKYQCLQNAVGRLFSQRGQCVIRYDQCLNR